MTAYYNEFDKNAAAWLRELISDGLIAPGDVDERSIIECVSEELFNGFRLAVMNELRLKLNQLDAEFSIL